jgi:hypothetical protein
MKTLSVLLGIALLVSIGAMSAGGSGVRDQVDPALAAGVEELLAQSPLRDYAGLAPIAPAPAAAPYSDAPIIPMVIEAGSVPGGYAPLTDLDALYGVDGPPVVLPAPDAPPTDLVDDTPAMVATAWASPPLDAK